jgi:hypothetical protein
MNEVPTKIQFLQEYHSVTAQKTAYFIVTAVKASNPTNKARSVSHVPGISEIFSRVGNVGNVFSLATHFEPEHTFREALISCRRNNVCGRCCADEAIRPSGVRVEDKCIMTYELTEKLKLAQNSYKKALEIYWKEAKILWIEQHMAYENYKVAAHACLVGHPQQSAPSLRDCRYCSRSHVKEKSHFRGAST